MGMVSDIVAGASQLSIINGVVGLVTGLVGSAMNLTVELQHSGPLICQHAYLAVCSRLNRGKCCQHGSVSLIDL